MPSGKLELTGSAPTPGRYAKVSLFLRKQAGLSDDYFHAYWANNHVEPALRNKIFTDRVRRYNQHHITAKERTRAKECGIPVLEYDGIAEVWLDSFEDWQAIVTDTDFVKNVAPDESNFLEVPIHIMFGWDYLVIGDEWSPKGKQ